MHLTVTIFDEADPILAVITGPADVRPIVVRDYRGMYARPETPDTIIDYVNWLVRDWFPGVRIHSIDFLNTRDSNDVPIQVVGDLIELDLMRFAVVDCEE